MILKIVFFLDSGMNYFKVVAQTLYFLTLLNVNG